MLRILRLAEASIREFDKGASKASAALQLKKFYLQALQESSDKSLTFQRIACLREYLRSLYLGIFFLLEQQ